MLADHDEVPAAIPDPPVELVHLTVATATLSLAVPATAMDEAEVEVMVNPGVLICSDGGVVSPGAGAGDGGGAGVGVGRGGGAGVGGAAGVAGTLLP